MIPRAQLPMPVCHSNRRGGGSTMARRLCLRWADDVALFARARTGAVRRCSAQFPLTFCGVDWALLSLETRKAGFKSALPSESVIKGSVRRAFATVRYAPMLQGGVHCGRSSSIFCLRAVWALIRRWWRVTICGRTRWGMGILNGRMGLGAVIGATSLPRVRRR